MFCSNCGKELNDDASFCGGCGTPVNMTSGVAGSNVQEGSAQKAASAVQPSAVNTAKATASVVGAAAKKSPKVFIGAGIALLAVIAVVILAATLVTGACSTNQTATAFREAFEEQAVYSKSLPSAQYTADTPYKLTSCSVKDIDKRSETVTTAVIDATVENEAYKVTMQFEAVRYDYSNGSPSSKGGLESYEFKQLSKDVEAKAPVTKDAAHNLENVTSELSEDGKSCVVVTDQSTDMWFVTSNVKSEYTYNLNSNGWSFANEEILYSTVYKDIDGPYAAKTGKMLDFSSVEISDLNAETGSFTMQIALPEHADTYSTRLGATATVQATISPERYGSYAQKDGYSYYFEGVGTSNEGNGRATVFGYFTVGEDGSKTIEIVNGTIGTTTTYRVVSPSSTTFSFNGTLFKQ